MESRSRTVKKNIVYSVLLKAVGVGLSFLLLPLTVHYLTEVEYGIWVTLFSVMNWVNMLDMGIGLGLRNKLAEAVARDDVAEIRAYMSTGVGALSVMGGVLLAVLVVGLPFVPLQVFYNTTVLSEQSLYAATLWTGIFVIATFVLSVINQIYYAYQKAAVTGAIGILNSLIMLVIVYALTLQPEHELLYFVMAFGVASLASKGVFIVDFFRQHRDVLPRWRYASRRCLRGIVSLGVQFFIIQLACIALFSSADILITQKLGPEYIRAYDIAFKIFSVVTMLHGLICAPLWNAYTDAYVKQDFAWMRRTVRRMLWLMVPVCAGTGLLALLMDWLVALWIRMPLDISPALCVGGAWFVIISCFNNIWSYFLNGIGRVQLQMYLSILSAVSVIPLAWWLMDLYGAAGMLLATSLCLTLAGLPQAAQVVLFLRRHA